MPEPIPPGPPSEVATLRTPPYSAEAEQGVLGALLQEPQALALIADKLTEHSFFPHAHRLIWSAIVRLQMAGRAIDPISVHDECLAADPDAQFGGMRYLLALSECVPSARNIRAHAEIVAERAASRLLIASLDGALTAAWKLSTPLEDRIAAAADAVSKAQNTEWARKPSIRLLDYDALLAQHAQQRWLVKKAIPCNAVGMLFGGSGTYKTFVALDLALRVAHGMQWLGRKTMSGDVVYLAAEGGTGICDRMTAWYRVHKDNTPTPSFRVIPQTINLSEDTSEVKAAIEAAGLSPCLIVIDTMSQTSAAEENSATETAHYLRELGAMLRDVWQCCVLIIHHTGHGATERPRGSSALRSNIDFLLGLFLDGDGSEMCTLTCEKQKDGERFKDESLRVVKVELGRDEDGDVIDSMVAFWVDNGSELRDAVRHERERGKRGYLATLCDLAQDGMEAEELRKKFYDACGLDKSDSRRRTFNRTIEKAAKANLVAIVDEKVRVFSKV